MKKLFFLFPILLLLTHACKTDKDLPAPEVPFNPFDTINYNPPVITPTEVDSASFLGLHHFIFSQKCNQPACHDGSFEPDFRTVESAYNTLVFHPINKNYNPMVDGREPLPYRVTPFDPDQSMLYKRITEHFLPNFERMPSSGIALEQKEINLITNWITEGAKDIFGNVPSPTSTQPACYGLLAYLPDSGGQRIDTARINGFNLNPFIAPADQNIALWFLLVDMDINYQYVLGNELMYNKLLVSNDFSDFSNASELDLDVSINPELVPSIFSQPTSDPLPHYQNVTFNPSDYGFQSGDYIYFQILVQDADHNEPTSIPQLSAPVYLRIYFSAYLQ